MKNNRMAYRRYIILIFVFIAFSGWSQEKKLSKMRLMPDWSVYNDSARLYLKSNPAKSFDYIEKTLALSIKANDKTGEAIAYQSLGLANFGLNQYDLAIDYYKKANRIFEDLDLDQESNETNELIGDAYLKADNKKDAIDYYEQSLRYYQRNDQTDKAVRVKKNLADLYTQTGESEKALSLLDDVLNEEKKRKNKTGIIEAQNSIASVYQQTNQSNEAIRYYDNSSRMARESKDNDALKSSLRGKSKALRQNKNYDEELEVRQEILGLSDQQTESKEVAEENLQIGTIYLEKKETDKAIPYIRKSIDIADQTKDLNNKVEALKVLSTAYSQQQNYDKALELYKDYVSAMDDIYKRKEEDILASARINATLNRKLERLDLIEKDLEINRKTLDLLHQEQTINVREMQIQRMLTYFLSAALLILTIASVFILRSANLKRKANQMLALRSLRSQMNPHFIYNSLNSVNNYISKNDEKAANKYLSDFSRLMRSVMDNSKHDFIPLTAEIEILKIYLTLEHSRFNDKFDYTFTVDEALEAEAIKIPPMLIQPFIENAIWHGLRYLDQKGMLKVEIKKNAGQLEILIEDNGIGRQKSAELKTRFQKEHVSTGLMNIENRISIINQLFHVNIRLEITDREGDNEQGTRVVLLMPLNVTANL